MKNLLNKLVIIAVAFFCGVSVVACGNNGNQDGKELEYDIGNGNTQITIPAVPDTNIGGGTGLPQVDESTLSGNYDTSDATAIITLGGNTATFTGSNVTITTDKSYSAVSATDADDDGKLDSTGATVTYGTVIEITKSGTYVLQGTLDNGFVAVSKKEIEVTLVLNGVNIYSPQYSGISCLKKSPVTITLATGSINYVTDGASYTLGYDDEEAANGAICIRKDLIINGDGKLIVNGNYNNGIGSKANLTISNGEIQVRAKNNALKGNDSITISGGKFVLNSASDGIKTDDESDDSRIITISNAEINIVSVNDAFQTTTDLIINSGTIKAKTGGGSAISAGADSAKGLKAGNSIIINGGDIDIDSNDDSIHSNGTITIVGGNLVLASADDGIHADTNITISGGEIEISKSYEGIESTNINLDGGTVRLNSTDDGINISGGKDSSATITRPGQGGRNQGGMHGGETVINGTLTITNGNYLINAEGDGLDSNGNIVMSGGTMLVYGPAKGGNEPVDFNGTFTLSGGNLFAFGVGTLSQKSISSSIKGFTASVTMNVNTNFAILDNSSNTIFAFKLLKSTKTMLIVSPTF
ncbi:MAG: carbohydrate-binding domain-containing protein, partial [Christensenellaceae bacterium]|nr:carbohydrate-binding domain-containing protein [Christensenellaceae bacterium]